MHFLGAVIGGNNTSEAETIIDPYSEYEEVEEYVLYTRHEFLQDSRRSDRELMGHEHGNRSEDMSAIIKEAKKRLSLNDEDALKSYAEYCGYSLDEDGNVVSTANRDAFYDWYEFGGRWEEMVGGLQGITCGELTERYGNGDSEVRELLDCNVSVSVTMTVTKVGCGSPRQRMLCLRGWGLILPLVSGLLISTSD